MGEVTAYLIPDHQNELAGREDEIADQFWNLGIFLQTASQKISKRLQQVEPDKLPTSRHQLTFSGMGIEDPGFEVMVPGNVYDAMCPHCGADIYEDLAEALQAFTIDETPIQRMQVTCSTCGASFAANQIKAPEIGLAFAKFYLWISDVEVDQDATTWEPAFHATVESLIGPCRQILAWDT